MRKLFRILKEISNYFFLRRQIRRNKDTEDWKKLKYDLRVNLTGVIYTVINLPPEVLSGEEVYWRHYIIEETKPINDYLATLNLSEIIRLEIKRIDKKNSFAYLVRYKPLFKDLSFWWLLKWKILIWITTWLQFKYDIFSYVVPFAQKIWGWISPVLEKIWGWISPLIEKIL